jgi:tetratricopeptide (TPR) repeat protein
MLGQVNAQSLNSAENSYNEGIKLKNAEKYNEALLAFKDAIDKNPDYTDALYEAGWSSNELEEYGNAITFLQKAKLLKSSATIFFELAYAYDHTDRKDEAKENYKKALELYPKYYDADKYLGDIFYDEENYQTALSYFKKYFETSKVPDNHYYYKAGRCANYLKDYADVLLYLEKYQPDGQKDFAKKYVEIGHAYYMIGYNDDALGAYQKALDAIPTYGDALRGMANVYYNNLEDDKKALEYFKLALQYDEENSRDYYYKAGWIYMKQQKYVEAIPVLQKAIDNDAKDLSSREAIGYAYYMLNKYDDAIYQFSKAIELDAQSKRSYYYKGLSYVALSQIENAREVYYQLKPINRGDAEKLLKEVKQKEKSMKSIASNRVSKKQAGH